MRARIEVQMVQVQDCVGYHEFPSFDATDMNQTLEFEIGKLSVAEKIALVEDVWDGIARASHSVLPLTDAQRIELERRVVQYERTPEVGKTLDDILSKHNLAV